MVWDYATQGPLAENDMAAALASSDEAEMLQSANRLSARNNGQARHLQGLEMWSVANGQ